MTLKIILGVVAAIVVITILTAVVKSGHWFRSLLTISLSGFAALFAINLLGTAIDITIPLNGYTLATSGILGVPGTILTLAVMTAISAGVL